MAMLNNQRVNLFAQRQVPQSNIKGVDGLSDAIGESRCPILPASQSLAVQSFVSISLGFSDSIVWLSQISDLSRMLPIFIDFPMIFPWFSHDFPMISRMFFQDVPLICHGSKSHLPNHSSGSNEGLGHILEGTFHLACGKTPKKTLGFSTGNLMGIHGIWWFFWWLMDGFNGWNLWRSNGDA